MDTPTPQSFSINFLSVKMELPSLPAVELLLHSPALCIEEVFKKPFLCAGYARRYAEILLTQEKQDKHDDIYTRASAWNFQYHNRKIWSIEQGVFDPSILEKGMLLGIRLPYSIYSRRRDERGNPARNTHMAVFDRIENNAKPVYMIAHNVGGVLLRDSLFDFLKRNEGSCIVDVFAPREKSLLTRV